MGETRKEDVKYLDKERTGNKGNIGNETQNASAPEEPEDAVIYGECETGFLPASIFSPFLLTLLPLASDRPPDALQPR